jgi:hypothetical protein
MSATNRSGQSDAHWLSLLVLVIMKAGERGKERKREREREGDKERERERAREIVMKIERWLRTLQHLKIGANRRSKINSCIYISTLTPKLDNIGGLYLHVLAASPVW